MPAPPAGRVLVVEDEAPLLESYDELLSDAGYSVATAIDGAQALRHLEAEAFDLVLTDIFLPDMTGVDVLRAVRARDLDVPVIINTGNPTVDTAIQALELGALRYLTKPVRADELLAAVAQAVRLRRLAALKREALLHLDFTDHLVGDRAGLEATLERTMTTAWMALQPVFEADTGLVFGHEALLRSRDPAAPDVEAIIGIAERLGRIEALGRYVRALAAAACPAEGNLLVNLHPAELGDPLLYRRDSPLAPLAGRVILEVTERAAIDGIEEARRRVHELRDLGYRIAIDDLGAGYAGLTSFALLEPDIVKLDMGLVRGVDSSPVKRKLIGSMATVCRDLGIRVVAEGIETPEERDCVRELGCDLLQGFLLGRPEAPGSAKRLSR